MDHNGLNPYNFLEGKWLWAVMSCNWRSIQEWSAPLWTFSTSCCHLFQDGAYGACEADGRWTVRLGLYSPTWWFRLVWQAAAFLWEQFSLSWTNVLGIPQRCCCYFPVISLPVSPKWNDKWNNKSLIWLKLHCLLVMDMTAVQLSNSQMLHCFEYILS